MTVRRMLLLALVATACQKPPPEDPGEVAYHRAVALFAKASADSHDLTYRDPRFDPVLVALDEVPPQDELRPKADALAAQIKQARAEAELADQESQRRLARELADPSFAPLPRDAPFPAPEPRAASAVEAAAPRPSTYVGIGVGGPRAGKEAGPRALPDWYRQAGYLGLGKPANAKPGPPPPAVAPVAPSAQPTPVAKAAAAPAAAPSQPPAGPPAVYGLPGPAGRALLGQP